MLDPQSSKLLLQISTSFLITEAGALENSGIWSRPSPETPVFAAGHKPWFTLLATTHDAPSVNPARGYGDKGEVLPQELAKPRNT